MAAARLLPLLFLAFLLGAVAAARPIIDGGGAEGVTFQGIRRLLQDEEITAEALFAAARDGDLKAVEDAVEGGVDVNEAIDGGFVALHAASEFGHADVVEFLLSAGALVNTPNDDGTTPLYFASQGGSKTVVKLLLDAGADVDIGLTDTNSTPLMIAAFKGHLAVVRMLLKSMTPKQVNTLDTLERTALHWAATNPAPEIVEELLESGAKIDKQDSKGDTALQFAAFYGNTDVVKLLLKNGADTSIKNNDGNKAEQVICGCLDAQCNTEDSCKAKDKKEIRKLLNEAKSKKS